MVSGERDNRSWKSKFRWRLPENERGEVKASNRLEEEHVQ